MCNLKGEIIERAALPMLLPAWEDLCARTVEDNVYYAPVYARALLESVERDSDVRFAVVWDDVRLAAFLPFTASKFPLPLLQPAGRAWKSKYTFSCMPLLDKFRKMQAAEALLEVLASASRNEWILPTVNTKGETSEAMISALEARGVPWIFLNCFSRAVLDAGSKFDEHMKRNVAASRRKGLARNRRRLEALGKVEHQSHSFGEGLDRAVSAFLTIEARGWKGKRGTALACDERTRQFARSAFTGNAARSICRADLLTLNGAPIAVSLITLAGRTGFAVKACYDESYRSYSPGLLLEIEVVRSFLSGNWACRLDGATAGDHVLDGLWSGRIEVADLMFSLSSHCSALRIFGLRTTCLAKRKIRAGLKRLIMGAGH